MIPGRVETTTRARNWGRVTSSRSASERAATPTSAREATRSASTRRSWGQSTCITTMSVVVHVHQAGTRLHAPGSAQALGWTGWSSSVPRSCLSSWSWPYSCSVRPSCQSWPVPSVRRPGSSGGRQLRQTGINRAGTCPRMGEPPSPAGLMVSRANRFRMGGPRPRSGRWGPLAHGSSTESRRPMLEIGGDRIDHPGVGRGWRVHDPSGEWSLVADSGGRQNWRWPRS